MHELGCNSSHEGADNPDAPAAPGDAPPAEGTAPGPVGKVKKKSEKLLDKYILGKSIGQGALGIVYSCKLRSTREEFAVIVIYPVETPLAEITREVEMLRLLKHACAAGMKDVFYEKVFVCLVLVIYKGSDTFEGMQSHWQSKA